MAIKKIIIIGAGIAGLAASARLIEYGFDVLILEARDHYGGRISTKNVFGMPFGLGASWIHGDKGNPMTTLAKKTHTKMAKVDPNKFVVFDHKGEPFPYEDKQKFDKKFELLLHQAKKIAFDSENDISLFCALSKIIEQYPFSPIEYELYKTKLLFFESYIGANDTALSARYWDQEEAWPGENCFLTSTYQPIIDDLAAHCNIKLNTIVTKINMILLAMARILMFLPVQAETIMMR